MKIALFVTKLFFAIYKRFFCIFRLKYYICISQSKIIGAYENEIITFFICCIYCCILPKIRC